MRGLSRSFLGLQQQDWNGDGLTDLQFRLVNGPLQDGIYQSGYRFLPNGTNDLGPYATQSHARAPDLLATVSDGLGATAGWTHRPLSDNSPATDASVGCDMPANPNPPKLPLIITDKASIDEWSKLVYDGPPDPAVNGDTQFLLTLNPPEVLDRQPAIDHRHEIQNLAVLRADEPVDARGGKCAAQRRGDRNGMHDVAQRPEPDDQHTRQEPAILFSRSRVAWVLGSPTMAVRPP